jgi:methyl-accepting chemotaxis protein
MKRSEPNTRPIEMLSGETALEGEESEMRWSVGTKIGMGYSLALIILIIIGVVSYRTTTGLIETADKVAHTHKVLEHLLQVPSLLKDVEAGQRGHTITGEERYLEQYNSALNGIDQEVKELRELTAENPNQQRRLDNLEPVIQEKLAFAKEVIDLRRNKGFEASRELTLTGTGKETMDQIRQVITAMENEENALLKQRSEAAAASARNTILTILVGIFSSFVLLASVGFLITRNIARPLQKISGAAEEIAAGNLSITPSSNHRKDEIGVLSQTFGQMTRSLREKAGVAEQIAAGNLKVEVKPQSEKDLLGNALATMVENLRSITGEIKQGVNVLASSASEIMASTALVASGSAETATAMSQTTATVEEVKQTAQVSSQKAKQVSDGAQKVVQVSQTGKKAVEDTIEGMNRISEQMEAIAESTVRLSEQGQAIGEIIATVNDLAEQSNLLAVNAAIEAAKAGEQGRGFVVVAQEIKSLAEQSKHATTQVRTILNDIQKATNAAVMATEQGSKAVEVGVRQSTEAMGAISTLANSITESAQAATQIAASSHQQLVGMDQVALAMENIKQASAQNAASTKQTETSAQSLHELGQRLKQMVEQYRV